MQITQERNFGFLISDTFNFFKIYGKDYFKSYFIINGIILLLISLFSVFAFREFFMQLFIGNASGESYIFEEYFSNNAPTLIGVSVLMFILILIISITSYTFPIFYLRRLVLQQTPIKTDDIVGDMKSHVGKFLIFALGTIFILLPMFFVVSMISSLLIFLIIGIPLLILIIPAFMILGNVMLFHHMTTDSGFFDSLGYVFKNVFRGVFNTQKSRFWKYWSSTIILLILMYIINLAISMIPYILLLTGMSTIPQYDAVNDPFSNYSIAIIVLMFLFYVISILASMICYNFISINMGLIYYDSRDDLHRKNQYSEIDSIGLEN